MSYKKKLIDANNKYAEGTYVRLVRVSDAAEGQDSDNAQLAYLKAWADERGMVWAGKDYIENSLSGSLPGNRLDLKALFERAETKKDFQFVLTQRVDRATRGGVDHLFWLEFELRKRGVRIVYPGDGLPEGTPYEQSLRAFKADAAKEQSFSISQRSAQGGQYALETGRISAHSRTPYGTYRLYSRSDGSPLFVIKDLRDGRQEKLSWPELNLIDTYGQIGGKAKGHYRKQKAELVCLAPGDPHEHQTVVQIYRWRYIEGYAGRKIAGLLNERGVKAPMGGAWSPRQVESIYENEDYTGNAIANRRTEALYHCRQSGRPKRVELDDVTATTAQHVKSEVRAKDEWYEGTEPRLDIYLGDENLRQTAIAQQKLLWERRLDPTWVRKNKAKHPNSPYLLTGLLMAKQDGESLVGTMTGDVGHETRVYRHKRGVRECRKGNIFNRTFNAVPLERAVLDVLQQILLDWPALEARLLVHVKQQIAKNGEHDAQLEAKRLLRANVREQLLLFIRTLSTKTRDDLAPEIRQLESGSCRETTHHGRLH